MSERALRAGEDPDDEDALHWAGDDARGLVAPRLGGAASDAPVVEDEADAVGAALGRPAGETALRVGTGAFALLYLAIAVGWILSAQLLGYPYLDLAGEIGWQFGEFLAMVAAVLWFLAVLSLTPSGARRRGATRVGWLLLGLVVLLPWPILLRTFG